VTVRVSALQGRFVIGRTHPTCLCECAEHDSPRLYTRCIVFGSEKMVEGNRADPIVALATDVGSIESTVFPVGGRLVGIDIPAGRSCVTRGAVLQGSRQTAPVAERAGRGAGHSPDAVQVRAVAAVAGIESGRVGFAVEIPRCTNRVQRGYDAEGHGNLKDPGMGRQRRMTDFTTRIAEAGINEPAELDIEARVAARSSGGIVRMTLLAIRKVGHGCLAVVVRVRPAGRVSHLTMAERAVETTRYARIVCGDDRGPQMSPGCVTEGTGRGVRSGGIVNRVGVARRGIGFPWNRRMGRPYGYTVRHVAWTGGPARCKTAYPGCAAAEVGPMAELATLEAAVGTGL